MLYIYHIAALATTILIPVPIQLLYSQLVATTERQLAHYHHSFSCHYCLILLNSLGNLSPFLSPSSAYSILFHKSHSPFPYRPHFTSFPLFSTVHTFYLFYLLFLSFSRSEGEGKVSVLILIIIDMN